ncbi:MAG: S8 family serine peptidase [Actinomycetota bacterium]|nr:S8 family serine peptidase [Actinomycetota bacterium]
MAQADRTRGRRGRACAALVAALAVSLVGAGAAEAARLTGRQLVVFEKPSTARSSSLLDAVLARTGVAKAGPGVPRLGIATVRGPAAALARLRRDPSVRSVSAEWQRDLRRLPNDPALNMPETAFGGLPGGAPIQWSFGRENFPGAWDVTTGGGAIVGVLDSGIDGNHPELGPKLHSADEIGSVTGATVDEDGHGTHVSGLACAATDNGNATAGAGWDCRLAFVKIARLFDEDIVAGIDQAVRRGADAINMSFGGGGSNAALDLAINRAVDAGVVLVASAANGSEVDQGAPASHLQPGDAPDIAAGRGLVVTAVDFLDRRAGTGRGPQISLGAYGFSDEANGPPGLISTYPGNSTPREAGLGLFVGCECRRTLGADARYAYLQGTSMAAPQVTALAALVGQLNPFLSAREKIRLIKETARRSGGWSPDLGWGIIDAGRAVETARRIDRTAPASSARAAKRVRVRRRARVAALRLRWSGSDQPGSAGLLASGLATYDVYMRRGRGRYRRIRKDAVRRSAKLRLRPGVYRFYTRARDRSGNTEGPPRRPDARVVVRR